MPASLPALSATPAHESDVSATASFIWRCPLGFYRPCLFGDPLFVRPISGEAQTLRGDRSLPRGACPRRSFRSRAPTVLSNRSWTKGLVTTVAESTRCLAWWKMGPWPCTHLGLMAGAPEAAGHCYCRQQRSRGDGSGRCGADGEALQGKRLPSCSQAMGRVGAGNRLCGLGSLACLD